MTNTFDGNIVLDVDENKDQSGHLIKFKKTGFANNNEYVRNAINNAMVNVEPSPKVRVRHLLDTNNKFYTISKVKREISTKDLLDSLLIINCN
jgi:hypothetical protein